MRTTVGSRTLEGTNIVSEQRDHIDIIQAITLQIESDEWVHARATAAVDWDGMFTVRGPHIVCLCGSTRFADEFTKHTLLRTMRGQVVLGIGVNLKDETLFADMPEEVQMKIKANLDRLHLEKIDLAHEVLIINKGGYIGESTRRELLHALKRGKSVTFTEPLVYFAPTEGVNK